VTTPTQEPQLEGSQEVANLMQVLVKALRALQLYLPNNPVYQRAMQNLQEAFGPVWEYTDDLELEVQESELAWGGTPVLVQDSKSESVPWLLYKDGVRSLTVLKGAEEEEIVRLLRVIHRAKTLDPDASDDLLTLLWEQDFQLIRYDFVQLGMDDVAPLQKVQEEPSIPPEEMRQQIAEEAAQEAERPQPIVSIDDFDSTMYFLDDSEIQYLNAEFEREYRQDLRGNVLSMLFDLLELQTYSTVRAELLSIIENFIPYLLAVGDFRAVAYILREIRVVLERARELLPEHRTKLQDLPGKLSEPAALGQLLQSLDEATVHPTEEELGELFRELRPSALNTVLAWLPRLSNERVRALLYGAARRLAQAFPNELVAALSVDDQEVLLETVRLAGQLRLPPVIPALGSLLEGASTEVRRAAVAALTATGSPGALQQLERAIEDADRDVRIGAVRALATQRYARAHDAIAAIVMGKRIREADLTEKTAFFEAYGALAGAGDLARMRDLLEPRGFLKKKEDPQIRACAAMAIGRIDTPEAKAVLERASNDKDPLVRNAVANALRGGAPA
jgi:hypothetical protein